MKIEGEELESENGGRRRRLYFRENLSGEGEEIRIFPAGWDRKASHSEPTTPRWWDMRVPRALVLRQHQEDAGGRENSCWMDLRSLGVA